MKQSILSHLVCPYTLEPLMLDAGRQERDDVIEGTLRAGNASYAILDGIPNFVSIDLLDDPTIQSFAQKWAKHKYYRAHTSRFYTQWYLERFGFHEASSLREYLAGATFILDAGTGAGRAAANLADHSPAHVFSVDTAWEALSVASKEVQDPRVTFIHADINRLPFRDEFFDVINCDQVIHHTAKPRETFEYLRRKLKVGGKIFCYIHRRKGVIREFVDDYVRDRVAGLTFEEAQKVCEGITRLGQALAKLGVEVEVEEDIPCLGIRKGKTDIQRFFHWNVMKCFWNDEFDFYTNNVVNVDWYHPKHCHRLEPDEFRSWFARGWEIEAWDVQEAGISCRARKA